MSTKKTTTNLILDSSFTSNINQCNKLDQNRCSKRHSLASFRNFTSKDEQNDLTTNSGSSRYFLRRRTISTPLIDISRSENVPKEVKRQSVHNLTERKSIGMLKIFCVYSEAFTPFYLEKNVGTKQPLSNIGNTWPSIKYKDIPSVVISKNFDSLSESSIPLSLPKEEHRRLKKDYKNYSLYPKLAINAHDFIKFTILTPAENLFSHKDLASTLQRSIPHDEFIKKFKEDQKLEQLGESTKQ